MKEYVAGFLFSRDKGRVALILKNRPDWQAGKYNAIGGRIETENEEAPLDAMWREFKEETGVSVTNWREFAILHDERGWSIRFYYGTGDTERCKTMTDETVRVVGVYSLPHNVIPNLRWLIPMALSMEYDRADGFVIKEFISASLRTAEGEAK